MTATARALEALALPLRRLHRAATFALALAAAVAALAFAAWLARAARLESPAWVPWAWVAAAALGAGTAWRFGRRAAAYTSRAVAASLEAAGGWRTGSLTALLEPPAAGTSADLLGAADRRLQADLGARGDAALAGEAARLRRRALRATAGLAAMAALLAAARPGSFRGASLWHPIDALEVARMPVRLAASDTLVDRGGTLRLAVRAAGRRQAFVWLRAPGEPWQARPVALDSLGAGALELADLRGDLHAHATSGGRSSDTLLVRVRQPVFVEALALTARYPAYLGLEPEPLPASGDTLVLPEGTRLRLEGQATAPLARAAWRSGGREVAPLEVRGAAFTGELAPRADGTFELLLATADGSPVAGDTVRLPVRVVPDAAPQVTIAMPGADTTLPPSFRVPLVADARDDHGLRQVVLESRRIARTGVADAPVREVLPLPPGTPDRALLSVAFDLSRRGLAPGDTVRYVVLATDNAPAPRTGRSREYVLRVPTQAELRAGQREAAQAIAARLDSLAQAGRQLERRTEDASKAQARQGQQAGRTDESAMRFDEAKKAEALADQQRQMLEQAEEMQDALRQLEQAAEAAGTAYSAWQARLQEIREQLERAMTPELREKLAALEEALRNLDQERTQDALKDLARAQQEMREALERARELFRRAALEGELKALEQDATELAQEQQRWNDEVLRADSAQAAAAEEQLAAKADSLAGALQEAGERLQPEGRDSAMQALAQQAQQAAQQMRQAAKSAKQGKRQQAKQEGQQAAQQLQQAGEQLEDEQQALQQEWKQEVLDALDRILADVTRVAERQLATEQAFRRGGAIPRSRAQQAANEESVRRLVAQVQQVSGKNALVSPQIAVTLAAAQIEMQQAREAVATANASPREAAERAGEALDALNLAAAQLLRTRNNVSGSGSGSGMAEAMEQMRELAQQQGQLGQQAGGMMQQGGTPGLGEMLRQLAMQQRQVARQLERMRGQGAMPGAGEMAQEAEELARRLEAQRLDREVVERQERLFKRMLDAGRTLQGQEQDEKKERESTAATGDEVRIPPALRRRLADDEGASRFPTWDELQLLSPGERRLVVDYFRRLGEVQAGGRQP